MDVIVKFMGMNFFCSAHACKDEGHSTCPPSDEFVVEEILHLDDFRGVDAIFLSDEMESHFLEMDDFQRAAREQFEEGL